MAIKNFRKFETTYNCRCCKKLTRNTGGDDGPAKLCRDCFDLSSNENYLFDNGQEEFIADYGDECKAILTKRPELKPLFQEIVTALGM